MADAQLSLDRLRWVSDLGRPRVAWPTLGLAVCALGSFIALGLAAADGVIPWAVSIPLQGFAAFAGFTPMHDASHRAVSQVRWLNELVGWVCGVPILAPFSAFRYLHDSHHAHTNDPARDPDMWSSKAKSRAGIVARWIMMDLHYLVRYISEARERPRTELASTAALLLAMWSLWSAAIASGHGLELLLCWMIPARLAIITLSVVFDWIPHHPRSVTGAEDPYRASNVYEDRWLSPPLLAQNYHLVHHLFPGVPFSRYGRVYWQMRDELLERGGDLRRIGGRLVARAASAGTRLRVSATVDETADARTYVLDIPAAARRDYAYRAGQFVTVEVPVSEHAPLRRCYSLSGDPAAPTLAITVKRHPEGRASRWLHEHLVIGAELAVGRPAGRFVLAPGETRPLALFAAGSGITPVIAILESALRTTRRRAVLVYANRDAASMIFRDRLDELARVYADRFTLIHHLDDARGFLDAATAAKYLERDADVYLCGPTAFMDLVERAAVAAEIPAERRFSERFTPRSIAAPGPAPAIATSFTAIRHGTRHLVTLAAHETLLAAARRCGLEPRSSCEGGYCGTCISQLICGHVATTASGPLGDGELARGFILPCSARPIAPDQVVVDFDAVPSSS